MSDKRPLGAEEALVVAGIAAVVVGVSGWSWQAGCVVGGALVIATVYVVARWA